MRKLHLWVPLFIVVSFITGMCWSQNVYGQDNYEGKKIYKVNFKGLVQNDEITVKSVINTKPRSKFSQKTIDDDIKALYKLNMFSDIKVDVTEAEEGLIVTFIVTEFPTVRQIIIKGNKKVAERTIRDEILIKKGSPYRKKDLLDDVEKIKKLYESKGFPNTKVTYEIKKVKEKEKKTGAIKNSVDVIFNIKESRRMVVISLEFSGIHAVSEEKLRRLIKTKQRGYWFSAGYFKESQFELDKKKILRYYGEKGYIDAKIIKVDRSIVRNEKKNRDEMSLIIYINEGSQYRFEGVNISGNKVFTNKELYALISLKAGDVFNKTMWDTNIQSIRNLLAENGYIYYQMDIVSHKDPNKHTISYDIHIVENSKAHIEHIFVTGNKKTKEFVIRRELEVHEGEIFNAKKIQDSINKLYNLQYFSTVNIDVKTGSELGLVDLIFNVEEQRTGMFSFGLSYSTAGYGLSLFEEVSANNFMGRGIKLHEKVNVGFTNQSAEVGIDEPWLFNKPISAGITLGWSRTEYGTGSDKVYTYNDRVINNGIEVPDGVIVNPDGTFDYTNAGSMSYVNTNINTAFRLGKRFARYYGINSELSFSVFRNYSDTGDVPFDSSLRDQFNEGWPPWLWKNYISVTAYRDSRDLTTFATRGTYVSQTFSLYGGILGGYSNFIKLNTDMNANIPTFWKFVLSGRFNVGFIFPYFGMPLTIDDNDYIRVDCLNEGRGWQNPSQWGSLYVMRGRSELNISLEHRFPLEKRVVWGLTFFDISGLYPTPQDFSINPKDLYYSFGMGISFVIPGFPIRFYLARRFKYDTTLNKFQFANSQSFFRSWDFIFSVAGYF